MAQSSMDFLKQLSGWKRQFFAFAIGSVMTLSMPPYNVFPLVWLCLPALILMLQGTTSLRQAFATGWSFAFGFFVFSLYWIAASMFVDFKTFWWAVPFSVAGLPALFAIYYGAAAAIARKIGVSDLPGIVVFGLLWFLADYARGHLFTGFPWILLGYVWSGHLQILQITSVIGIYGLTLLTAIAACLPAALGTGSKPPRIAFSLSLAIFVVVSAWGDYRLQNTRIEETPNVFVRLVQPNIDQKTKWAIVERENHFRNLIELTAQKSDRAVTHYFWPETASTYYLSEDGVRRDEIAAVIPAASTVMTGVVRRITNSNNVLQYYNSLVAVDGLGRLVAGYDKAHLVPFGEYMPFRKYIPIHAIATMGADFSSGPGPKSLRVAGLPLFSPLICYEAIFPGNVVDDQDRPDFLLNLTNDGWYGRTIGPYQHFAIARVRAIEEGLPLLRVANTGISGIIDPVGRIIGQLGLGERGVLDSELPKPISKTIFSEMKEESLWTLFLLVSGVCFWKNLRLTLCRK